MTTSAATRTPTPTTAPDSGLDSHPDPRPGLRHAVDVAARVIAAVPPAALDGATPCEGWDVRRLIGHMVGALDRIARVGRGEDATVLLDTSTVSDDGWAPAWTKVSEDVSQAWADPRRLGQPAVLPFATMPGAAAVALYAGEVLVHTWDLARATGQVPAWDDAIVAAALQSSHHGLPAQPRGGDIPFGAVVAIPADAPAIEALAAWQGRDPRWTRGLTAV